MTDRQVLMHCTMDMSAIEDPSCRSQKENTIYMAS